MSPTLSQENYLKALYHLAQGEKVTVQKLARHLGVTAASALGMVRKLQAQKMVTYRRSKGIELTRNGERTAIEIIRRHRLWEVFLHDKLGYRWDEVHSIAEELEHVSIEGLADRLAMFLGDPLYDPHGDPIPQHDGTLPPQPSQSLAEQLPGRYQLVGLKNAHNTVLAQLEHLKLALGQVVQLQERLPYDGTLVLRIGREQQYVSRQLAEQLLVNPLP